LVAEAKENFDWERLLELIDQGRVIPVVGGELLQLPFDAGAVPLAAYLAGKLAERLGVTVPAQGFSLADPIADMLDRAKDPGEAYFHLHAILRSPLPTPTPLKQLADIDPFKLYVTSSFLSSWSRGAGWRLNSSRFLAMRASSSSCRVWSSTRQCWPRATIAAGGWPTRAPACRAAS
jgi:hypothetical protein